jgi:hypothetical protein
VSDGSPLVIVSDLHLGSGPAAGAWGAAPASAKLFRWTGAAEPLADRMVPD